MFTDIHQVRKFALVTALLLLWFILLMRLTGCMTVKGACQDVSWATGQVADSIKTDYEK